MKFNKIGFYSEISKDESDKEHIKDYINKFKSKNKQKVLNYLNNGICLVACGGTFPDIIDDKKDVKLNHDFLTDGEYVWYRDISYYVDKYNVYIDENFLRKIDERNYNNNFDIKQFDGKIEI